MRTTFRRALCGTLLTLAACGPSGGPEGAGDRSYTQGQYEEALAAYAPLAETTPSPRLWAKIGATALRLGQLREATAANPTVEIRNLKQIRKGNFE